MKILHSNLLISNHIKSLFYKNLKVTNKLNSIFQVNYNHDLVFNVKAVNKPIEKIRNIGISAHIDSGKTTLTERLLYYCGRIDEMHEVKGKDKVGAVMDSMELERQRGITIQSAATYVEWKGFNFNIIDTPGHVDFTVEVERALRVLDGAILVLCSVGGVQAQTLTVTRQMQRYKVPCIAFINKIDRLNANPVKVVEEIRDRIGYNSAFINIPIGLEGNNKGIVDLIDQKAIYFDGPTGNILREGPVPEDSLIELEFRRQELIENLSNVDDIFADLFLNEKEITKQDLISAIRRSTISRKFVPVLTGTALKNTGIQPVLDAVIDYLPNPGEVENFANIYDDDNNIKEKIKMDFERTDAHSFIGLAFKIETGKYGKLTYFRIYQGCLKKGSILKNTRTKKKLKINRLARIHANNIQEVGQAFAGDIVGIPGIDCATGDTFVDETDNRNLGLEQIHIPEPVISMSIKIKDKNKLDSFHKAISRFTSEDPTFHKSYDQECNETLISGMGELHLEIYGQRIEREYNCPVELCKPRVAFRETILSPCKFDYLHKRQTGGRGQYGRVIGYLEPLPPEQYTEIHFVNEVTGTGIPKSFVPHIEKGFKSSCEKGPLSGFKISGIKFRLLDGDNHCVDSNDYSFFLAAQGAMQDLFKDAKWRLIEPIMSIEVSCPNQYQGDVMQEVMKRNGLTDKVVSTLKYFTLNAEVPLNDMFGFSTSLRILTQGQGEFSMEFVRYSPAREEITRKLINEYKAEQKKLDKATSK